MAVDMGLARRQDAIEITTLSDVERLARTAVASGLVSVRRPEEAVVILLTGRELGLMPMQSLRGIHVVNGKPVLSADLLVAIVRRSGLCDSWQTVESTPARCEIVTRRRGESEPARKVWTDGDAKRAGLLGKGGPWVQYPAQMLRHRCAADLVREVYPDVVLGLYSAEEMEDAVRVEQPAPVVAEKPEGSRAFARFVRLCDELEGHASAAAIHQIYRDLLDGLHEEGADAADYVSGRDGAEALVWRACTLPLTEAERRAILADTTRSLAAKVDAAAEAGGDGLDESARWWIAYRASFTATEAPVVWSLLARVAAGLDGCDATATGKAKRALKTAVEALTPPPPPTGTDAPSAAQHEASVGDAAATSTTEAPRAWAPVTTSDGVTIDSEEAARERITTMTPHALRGSFRRHREHVAWCALIMEHWARRFSTTIDGARRELVAAAERADTEARDRESAKAVRKAA